MLISWAGQCLAPLVTLLADSPWNFTSLNRLNTVCRHPHRDAILLIVALNGNAELIV